MGALMSPSTASARLAKDEVKVSAGWNNTEKEESEQKHSVFRRRTSSIEYYSKELNNYNYCLLQPNRQVMENYRTGLMLFYFLHPWVDTGLVSAFLVRGRSTRPRKI